MTSRTAQKTIKLEPEDHAKVVNTMERRIRDLKREVAADHGKPHMAGMSQIKRDEIRDLERIQRIIRRS